MNWFQFVAQNLTGKVRVRGGFLGKVILQVQEYGLMEDTQGSHEGTDSWRWRDAVAEDMQRLVFPKRFEKVEE